VQRNKRGTVRNEMRRISKGLASLAEAFDRLGKQLASELPRPARGGARPRRRMNLSPQRRAALKLQGAYVGLTKQLSDRQKAAVKALRLKKGFKPAIAFAQRLVDRLR